MKKNEEPQLISSFANQTNVNNQLSSTSNTSQPAPLAPSQPNQNVQTQVPNQPNYDMNTSKEEVSTQREPGSIRLRLSAMVFDSMVLAVPINFLNLLSWYVGRILPSGSTGLTSIVWLLLFFLVGLGYYIYFNVKKGATPGKTIYGLKVVDINTNSNLTYKNSAIRELINRGITSIPLLGFLFGVINFFVVLSKPERRGIHDKAAHSQVYKVEKSWSFLKQLGFFIALIILSTIPYVFLIPQYFNQAQDLNKCVLECIESKTVAEDLEPNLQNVQEICLQECSK